MAGKKVSGPPEWQNDVAKLLGVDPAAPGKDVTVIKVMDVTQIKDLTQPSSAKPAEEGPALYCPNPCAEITLAPGVTLAPGLTILDQDSASWQEAEKQTNETFFKKLSGKPLPQTKMLMAEGQWEDLKKIGEVVADEIKENLSKGSGISIHINHPVKFLKTDFMTKELPGEGYGNLGAIQKLNLHVDDLKETADLGTFPTLDDTLAMGGGFHAGKHSLLYGHHNSGKSWLMQSIVAQGLASQALTDLYANSEMKIVSQIHDSVVMEYKTSNEKEVPMPENKICTLCGGTFGACKCCTLVDPAFVLKAKDTPKITWDQATSLMADFKAMMKSNPKVPFVMQPLTKVNLERFELHKGLFGDCVLATCKTQPNWKELSIPVDPANPDWEGFARQMFYTHFADLWLKHCQAPGRLAVQFDLETKLDGSVYSVVTLFRYYGDLQKPNSKGFGAFDLEVELDKYLTPKTHHIKGPNYDIKFHQIKPEQFKTELMGEFDPVPSVPSYLALKKAELNEAQANLKIVNDAIYAHNKKLTGPGIGGAKEDTLALTSLKSAQAGWTKKIEALQVEVSNAKLAQAKQMNLGQAPGGKFFEPSTVAVPADKSEIFGPLHPLPEIPELTVGGAMPKASIDLDTIAQKIKISLDDYFVGFPMKITDLPGFEEALHGTGDESFTKHTVFTLRLEAVTKLKQGINGFDLSSWITERTPPCCHYATFDECKDVPSLNQYFDKLTYEHFELKHGNAAKNHLSLANAAKALLQAHMHAQNPKLGAAWASNQFNAQLPGNAPKASPACLLSELALLDYSQTLETFFLQQNEEEFQEPEGVEVFELTLSNLTQEEVDDIMKTLTKSKSKQEVLVHKGTRKEVGTKSKAIVVFPFESSSMQVNGEPIMYKTQLNEDGTISCNCAGWTMGSAKNSAGRFCKHTKAIQVEAELAYKKWKKGIPLGGDFDIVPAAVANATSKTLYSALKEKVVPGQETMFKAKRIVEV
jgi:hypothetical protein